jgi:hypothetical protein
VGPVTWSELAPALESRDLSVFIAALEVGDPEQPYWQQHSSSVAKQIDDAGIRGPVLLVGHSGAGALMPSIAEVCSAEVMGYVFVDAGIPRNGESRLEAMRREVPEFAEQLRKHLLGGGRFPEWTVEMLSDIPSLQLRERVIAELRPRALDFFDEPIPVFAEWPDSPGAYLRFTAAYEPSAQIAERHGWPVQRMEGGHFQLLADPIGVGHSLIRLTEAIHSR